MTAAATKTARTLRISFPQAPVLVGHVTYRLFLLRLVSGQRGGFASLGVPLSP
jgi:hypothetical protein